jgi:DNA-binding NarL/FixJ family response regulator
MPRTKTPEQREAWATYMREYRKRQREGGAAADPRGSQPTQRQLEVLRAYADPELGGNQRLVADRLGISVSAVNNTLQRLMRRLGVREPSQAVMKLWVSQHGTTSAVPDERRGPDAGRKRG